MRILVATLMTLSTATAFGAGCEARSGPHTAALVELYTSEGCSSCPPADRWLSRLPAEGAAVVPIAFHVNYWDELGWADRFAQQRFTDRQREFSKLAGARFVYTPQVVLGGRDFRDWSANGATAIAALQRKTARVAIEMKLDPATGTAITGTTSARFVSGPASPDARLFLALTENGLASKVGAGENRGEKLAHDHVVREFAMSPKLDAAVRFTPKPGSDPAKLSLVAFVQDVKTGEILQALSAPICR